MKKRSYGVTALAFSSVLIALYCQFGAVALILTGSVFSRSGVEHATLALVLGALFFGLTFASYFLAYGYVTRKSWAWAGGIAFFAAFVVANLGLSVVSSNYISTVLPLAGAIVAIWYLNRPAVKAEFLGDEATVEPRATVPDALEIAEPAR